MPDLSIAGNDIINDNFDLLIIPQYGREYDRTGWVYAMFN